MIFGKSLILYFIERKFKEMKSEGGDSDLDSFDEFMLAVLS